MPVGTVRLASAALTETSPTEQPPAGDLPQGIDPTKVPKPVQDASEFVKGVVRDHGKEILDDAIRKASPDMSFEDPRTVANMDISKLSDAQKAAYYLDLGSASSLNKFMDDHYGDNLFAHNETTGEDAGQAGHHPGGHGKPGVDFNLYPAERVQQDIDAKLKQLEDGGISQTLGGLMNDNLGDWMKQNMPADYDAHVKSAFDASLQAGSFADKLPLDALAGANTTSLLARTYLAKDDFVAKAGDLDTMFHDLLSSQMSQVAPDMADYSLRTRGEAGAPPASMQDYKTWFASLVDGGPSKRIQPIVEEAFAQSDVAQKLKAAGYQPGTDAWDTYHDTFAKDVTSAYNNYWSSLRKGVKMDMALAEPGVRNPFQGENLPQVGGLDSDMYKAGVFHTVQVATMAAGLAGTIIAANGKTSDPQTAMALTYASTNMADMLAETAVRYLDPKGGGFQKLGLNQDGEWTQKISKYLPEGGIKAVEAAGKMLAGAGTVVFGAASLWKTVDAVKNGDAPAAVLNMINGLGGTVSGLATGAEGVLQWTNVVKNFATGLGMESAGAAAFDGTVRGLLATVGWGAGLVAGLGLTALGIYDMAKGAKVLDQSLDQANNRYIAPTTGWNYEWLDLPDPDISAAL